MYGHGLEVLGGVVDESAILDRNSFVRVRIQSRHLVSAVCRELNGYLFGQAAVKGMDNSEGLTVLAAAHKHLPAFGMTVADEGCMVKI